MKRLWYTAVLILLVVAGKTASAQNTIEQNRQVSGFKRLASAGPFQVHVKLNGTESVKISSDEALANDIETLVEDETLKIRFKKNMHWDRNLQKIDVYVTAKTLDALINSGSGSIKVDGTINTHNFSATLSGSGSISTNVKTQQLHAVISGSGSINMSGNADKANISLAGSGVLQGKSLSTQNTSASIAGSGHIYVAASQQLNTRVVGSGRVIYTGNAMVESTGMGSGGTTRAN
jgi:hypothetical protein